MARWWKLNAWRVAKLKTVKHEWSTFWNGRNQIQSSGWQTSNFKFSTVNCWTAAAFSCMNNTPFAGLNNKKIASEMSRDLFFWHIKFKANVVSQKNQSKRGFGWLLTIWANEIWIWKNVRFHIFLKKIL